MGDLSGIIFFILSLDFYFICVSVVISPALISTHFMKLINATPECFDIVKEITHFTINSSYPKYYSAEVVAFFLEYHSDENIKDAIDKKQVFILYKGKAVIGTGSIKENEIGRLFVLPQCQSHGYGSYIMDCLEKIVFNSFNEIILDASIPAYNLYLKRGYMPISYENLLIKQGHYLNYHVMTLKKSMARTMSV